MLLAVGASAANQSQHHSAYAGQEERDIKSLSAADLTELKAGSGWGMAKAAELNGVPGPRHLLEMRDDIGLSAEQVDAIQDLFEAMRADAVRLGERLIEQESLLEQRFRDDLPDEASLQSMLNDIETTRSALRFVHLSAHLKTPSLLSASQLEQYNRLRGYSADDPCARVPEGHDATMWKSHNGCD